MTGKTDRELLESLSEKVDNLRIDVAIHAATHKERDALVDKMAKLLWGNGMPGLVAQHYLLMLALPALSAVLTAAVMKWFGL